MFPIRDENPLLRTPVVTIALIAINAAAWLLVQGAGTEPALGHSVCALGLIPGELTGAAAKYVVRLDDGVGCVLAADPRWYTVVTSMFLHGGWLHIIGNMWFLWIFGNNVEDVLGRARFAVFYVLCGLGAAAAQIVVDPGSAMPMIGASGAIGGVMGAYVVLYPRVKVDLLVFLGILITTFRVPAFLMLGYWFALQLLGGLPQLGNMGEGGGVAFWAHVGGFAAGALLVLVLRDPALVAEHARAFPHHRRGRAVQHWRAW